MDTILSASWQVSGPLNHAGLVTRQHARQTFTAQGYTPLLHSGLPLHDLCHIRQMHLNAVFIFVHTPSHCFKLPTSTQLMIHYPELDGTIKPEWDLSLYAACNS